MARLGQPPGESYYDALAAYHEVGGDLAAAWEVRERELATTVGKGQLAYESQVRIKRVRLLRRLGRRPTRRRRRRARRSRSCASRGGIWGNWGGCRQTWIDEGQGRQTL